METNVENISKLTVMGTEINLATPLPVEDAKRNFESLVSDLSPDTAKQLAGVSYTLQVQGNALIVFRNDAHFG